MNVRVNELALQGGRREEPKPKSRNDFDDDSEIPF
jgi:hypothetical protein